MDDGWALTDGVDLNAVAQELGGGRRDNVVDPLVILCMTCADRRVVAHLQQGNKLLARTTVALCWQLARWMCCKL